MLAKTRDRLSDANAEHEAFTANVDRRDPLAVQHLAKLARAVGSAEVAVANAERALEGMQAMQRAVALGM